MIELKHWRGLPSGGKEGQVLIKNEFDEWVWADLNRAPRAATVIAWLASAIAGSLIGSALALYTYYAYVV